MTGNIHIVGSNQREFSDDEIRGFHALIIEPEQRLWDPGNEVLGLPALTSFFREILSTRPNQAVFLAKSGVEVVGMSALFVHTEMEARREAKLGFGVRTAWMRKGIATELVRASLAFARERGLRRLIAEAFPHNLRALRFLDRMGFTLVTPECPVEEPVHLAVFEKTLEPGI
jgi:RimJ/RimL family protein N-acetyltransferase